MTTREKIIKFLTEDNGFTEAEKWIVKMQYPQVTQPSNFEEKLWALICACDPDNLTKLSLAFPEKVNASLAWYYRDLATRIRTTGLNI